MAYTLDLSSSWAKLERAKTHVDQLRAEIAEAGNGDPKSIPLRREYDAEDRAVVYRVEHVIEVRPHWSLLVGDAAHNFRSALDHLAWQLAVRYFGGVEPTRSRVIQNIQYPVVTDPNLWPKHRFRQYMTPEDALIVEANQPFRYPQPGTLHVLDSLATLSNVDKHRLLHVIYVLAHQGTFVNTGAYRDCLPDTRMMPNGTQANVALRGFDGPPRPNDEVARVFVRPAGPHPDVDIQARLTGYVAVRESWNLLDLLDASGRWIAALLKRFDPSS